MYYLYNHLEVEEDYYEFEKSFGNYFKDGILFLKVRYVGETLEEDTIMEDRCNPVRSDSNK